MRIRHGLRKFGPLFALLLIARCGTLLLPPPALRVVLLNGAYATECSPLLISYASGDVFMTPFDVVSASSDSSAQFYSDLASCVRGSATSTLSLPFGKTSATFYVRRTSVGSDRLTLGLSGGPATTLDVATLVSTFNTGTGFDSTTNVIFVDMPENGYPLYVAGGFTHYNGISVPPLVRLDRRGNLDSTFNPGAGPDVFPSCITPVNDGTSDLYIGGNFTTYDGVPVNRLARITTDGKFVSTFNIGTGFNGNVQRCIASPDGSGQVYVAGPFTSFNGTSQVRAARINPDGTLDTSFNTGSGYNTGVNGLEIDVANPTEIYFAGCFTQYGPAAQGGVSRLFASGLIDATFGLTPGFNFCTFDINPVRDGSGKTLVATGGGTFNGGAINKGIVRLNRDGTRDGTFTNLAINSGGAFRASPLVDGTGRMYATGGFTTVGATAQGNLTRLLNDGTVDPSFAFGTGFNAASYFAVPLYDGSNRVYVHGQFSSLNGRALGSLVRLKADGSLDE